MGWYIKTEQQLLDSGWVKRNSWMENRTAEYVILQDMYPLLGTPLYGELPPSFFRILSEVMYKGRYYTEDMLIWIPE